MRNYLALIGSYCLVACALGIAFPGRSLAQSLGNAGTVEGVVVDPSGAMVAGAEVRVAIAISGYSQTTHSTSNGSFRLTNIPPNPYHLEVTASGFNVFSQDITIRNAIPVQLKVTLGVAGSQTTVNVEASGADVLENDP